jgi:ferredoxin--NADP+ reductase
MSEWVSGTVIDNIFWTDYLHSLKVEAEVAPFRAGQYTRLALDIDGVRVARPYSFVNAPDDALLEFYFNTVPQGPLSNRLAAMRAGDQVWVSREVAGFFTLDEVPAAPNLWLFATGTALGPFVSMLKTEQPWRRFERVVLVYAVRMHQDISYQGAITQLLESYPDQFSWIPFVSRESVDHAMQGRIPAAIYTGALQKRAGLNITSDTSQVMICGNPCMVKDTMIALKALGLRKNLRRTPGHITIEKYW